MNGATPRHTGGPPSLLGGHLIFVSSNCSKRNQFDQRYPQAAVLGAAFVALVLGAGGLAVALYHYYRCLHSQFQVALSKLSESLNLRKESKGVSPSLRAAQLYESVRIRPVVVEAEVMPQEAKSTKSKTMSYEVNPESCHI